MRRLGWMAALALAACGGGGGGGGEDDALPGDAGRTGDAVTSDAAVADAAATDAALADAAGTTADAAGMAADAAPPDAGPDLAPVDGPGPYGVGYREVHVTYARPTDGAMRTLRVALWYPTTDPVTHPVRYFRGLVVRHDVQGDATPAGHGPMPVLIFSHGSGGIAEQSFYFTERFASHGWLVAAPDHTGNTTFDGTPPPEIMWERPIDLSRVLNYLQALPADDPLAGRVGDRVVLAGHSYGGYTVLAAGGAHIDLGSVDAYCAQPGASTDVCMTAHDPATRALFEAGFGDPRVKLIIPMAPWGAPVFFPDGLKAIDVPVLLFTGARDATLPDADDGTPVWNGLDGADDLRVDFANGGHYTFANICSEVPGAIHGDGCGDGWVPEDEAHAAIDTYSMAFVRARLDGDTSVNGILDGTQAVDSDVHLSHHEQ
jgi:predicted dienelactone hydrolase